MPQGILQATGTKRLKPVGILLSEVGMWRLMAGESKSGMQGRLGKLAPQLEGQRLVRQGRAVERFVKTERGSGSKRGVMVMVRGRAKKLDLYRRTQSELELPADWSQRRG
jgi:hypothetical protein